MLVATIKFSRTNVGPVWLPLLLLAVSSKYFMLDNAWGFSVNVRKRMPGIWKLCIEESVTKQAGNQPILDSLFGGDDSHQVKNNTNEGNNDNHNSSITTEVLLKLQDDGSFRQCDEGYQEGKWISGTWELENEESPNCESTTLLLAINRQYFGPPHDTLLTGTFDLFQEEATKRKSMPPFGENNDNPGGENIQNLNPGDDVKSILSVSGSVTVGKFMYPKKHPSFFDEPMMMTPKVTGKFQLKQILSFFKLLPKEQHTENTAGQESFQQSDFYNRKFYMTFVPIKSIALERKWDDIRRRYVTPGEDQPVDIRAMGIEFFANNTFTMRAMNKLLRGRFEIEKNNRLWFQVSLFGAGRSMKGSVFSEGPGITQDDKRSYSGKIQRDNDKLVVKGRVTFGSDTKPPEVGSFLLREVNDTSLDMSLDDDHLSVIDEDDDEDGEDIVESVFE